MNCLICNNKANELFKAMVLARYNVQYYKCPTCGFIQTEAPYWLNEAYTKAMTKLDIGLIQRNQHFSVKTEELLLKYFNTHKKFLDYGGGYGMFVRMMRDKGFEFYRQDLYCQNLFAEYFDILDLSSDATFELITAFEVFEHLTDPVAEVKKMLLLTDAILFSTEIQPDVVNTPQDWWYFIPETGQHVALYSIESLKQLAQSFGCFFYTDKKGLHLFSKKELFSDPFGVNGNDKKSILIRVLSRALNKLQPSVADGSSKVTSLLQKDFDYIRNKINE